MSPKVFVSKPGGLSDLSGHKTRSGLPGWDFVVPQVNQPPQQVVIDGARAMLSPDELESFNAALRRGLEDGSAFTAIPRHCAIGEEAS